MWFGFFGFVLSPCVRFLVVSGSVLGRVSAGSPAG